MLAMAQVDYISFLRDKEGLSINSLDQRLGINWRTKRYADRDNWSPEIKKKGKRSSRVSRAMNRNSKSMIFFEANESTLLLMEMGKEQNKAVYYDDIKIADSLHEFLMRMMEDDAYYIDFA